MTPAPVTGPQADMLEDHLGLRCQPATLPMRRSLKPAPVASIMTAPHTRNADYLILTDMRRKSVTASS